MTTLTYVTRLQVKFSNMVQWMSLEFDSRCGFAQPEDKIGELLIPRRSGLAPTTQPQSSSKQNSPPVVSPYVDVSFDDLYSDWDRYALTIPPGVVLLPGQCMSVASTPLLVRNFIEQVYRARSAQEWWRGISSAIIVGGGHKHLPSKK